MKTIYKYPIKDPKMPIEMPRGASILCVQTQNNLPHIWAIVDPTETRTIKRDIRVCGTGHELKPEESFGNYIGTAQTHDGTFVWHFFDLGETHD